MYMKKWMKIEEVWLWAMWTHPADQRGSSWSWAARSWAEGAGVGVGYRVVGHFVAYSRSSRNHPDLPPQPRQYPLWARNPLKRPPPAHLRSLTTQNTCHRTSVNISFYYLARLNFLLLRLSLTLNSLVHDSISMRCSFFSYIHLCNYILFNQWKKRV